MNKCALCRIHEREEGFQVCSKCKEGLTKLIKYKKEVIKI